jgi:hypothetical protein
MHGRFAFRRSPEYFPAARRMGIMGIHAIAGIFTAMGKNACHFHEHAGPFSG